MDAEIRTQIYRLRSLDGLVVAAYEETVGEETVEVSALEALRERGAEELVEALAGFVRSCDATTAAVKAEIKTLEARKGEIGAARTWAEIELTKVLLVNDMRKVEAGPFVVSLTTGRERTNISENFDPLSAPAEVLRHFPERWEPDKVAIRKWLKANPAESIPGVSVARAPDKLVIK